MLLNFFYSLPQIGWTILETPKESHYYILYNFNKNVSKILAKIWTIFFFENIDWDFRFFSTFVNTNKLDIFLQINIHCLKFINHCFILFIVEKVCYESPVILPPGLYVSWFMFILNGGALFCAETPWFGIMSLHWDSGAPFGYPEAADTKNSTTTTPSLWSIVVTNSAKYQYILSQLTYTAFSVLVLRRVIKPYINVKCMILILML